MLTNNVPYLLGSMILLDLNQFRHNLNLNFWVKSSFFFLTKIMNFGNLAHKVYCKELTNLFSGRMK